MLYYLQTRFVRKKGRFFDEIPLIIYFQRFMLRRNTLQGIFTYLENLI